MFQSLNKSQIHHDNSEFLKGCQDVPSKNTDVSLCYYYSITLLIVFYKALNYC